MHVFSRSKAGKGSSHQSGTDRLADHKDQPRARPGRQGDLEEEKTTHDFNGRAAGSQHADKRDKETFI